MRPGSTSTRVKKSYSISVEAEQFIRRVRETRHIASDSEALDQLLRESMAAHRRGAIDEAYRMHYDNLPGEALVEETAWAEFASSHLIGEAAI